MKRMMNLINLRILAMIGAVVIVSSVVETLTIQMVQADVNANGKDANGINANGEDTSQGVMSQRIP